MPPNLAGYLFLVGFYPFLDQLLAHGHFHKVPFGTPSKKFGLCWFNKTKLKGEAFWKELHIQKIKCENFLQNLKDLDN